MEGKILSAIVAVLDEHYKSDDLDKRLVKSVMDVFEAENPTRQAVKYIGRRPIYSDGLYNSGEWSKDQVKLVPLLIAAKMLKHTDVYADGEKTDGAEIVIPPEEDLKDEDPSLDDGRHAIQVMTRKKQIGEFIHNNISGYNIDLPSTATLAEWKDEAVRLIDMYHLPK